MPSHVSPSPLSFADPEDRRAPPVHVVFAGDKGFLDYSAVAIWSAATHTKNLQVHFVHSGDLGPRANGLRKIVERFGGKIRFYDVCPDKFSGLPVTDHVTIATYYRLLIAELLPNDIQRVIYLDGDLIVRRSLLELYNWPIQAPGVAAVPEPNTAVENLGMPAETPYLNAGVLVLDLEYWRQSNVTAQLFHIANTMRSRLRFWDQDILALYLQGAWTFLPTYWNVHHGYFFGKQKLPWPDADPAIVHFSGAELKPPDYKVHHPYAAEFWLIAAEVAKFGFHPRSQTQSSLRIWSRRFRLWRSSLIRRKGN